jgi:hypothetical protein
MAGRVVILKTKGEDWWGLPRLEIDSGKSSTLPEGGEMSEQDERELLIAAQDEEGDEVEAHRKREMTDEPRSDDDSSDDFEAHRKRE